MHLHVTLICFSFLCLFLYACFCPVYSTGFLKIMIGDIGKEKKKKYLGHRIDENGLHPLEDKVKAILEVPSPRNVRELKSYLGLLSYYEKFLPDLSSVLAPLYQLLRKHVSWHWSSAERDAILASKDLLSSSSLLVHQQPLLALLNERKSTSPQASAGIRLFWSLAYEYTLVFCKTEVRGNADALSRLPLLEAPAQTQIPPELVFLMDHLNESPVTAEHICAWTRRDPSLSAVLQAVKQG